VTSQALALGLGPLEDEEHPFVQHVGRGNRVVGRDQLPAVKTKPVQKSLDVIRDLFAPLRAGHHLNLYCHSITTSPLASSSMLASCWG